jgi:hypothetical protein
MFAKTKEKAAKVRRRANEDTPGARRVGKYIEYSCGREFLRLGDVLQSPWTKPQNFAKPE